MKIGIISFAHMHAYSYAHAVKRVAGLELVGVSDDLEERGTKAASMYSTKWYADYRELLSTDIDAVIICSSNDEHAEIAIAAAKAGKHILCEKPIATTVEDAEAMIRSAEDNNVKLMIAFPCRYSPSAIRVKEMIEKGDLGRIVAMNGTNRGQMPGGWFIDKQKSGGGAVFDHTVHVLDVMRWYMPNAEVSEVYAEVGTLIHPIDIDDCGLLTFEFNNGVIASLDPSWSRPKSYPTWGDVTLEIIGTKGVVRLDLFRQNLTIHDDNTMQTKWEAWGADTDQGLVEDFVNCIRENTPPPITGKDGLKAMEVGLAAYRSAEQQKPVKLFHT